MNVTEVRKYMEEGSYELSDTVELDVDFETAFEWDAQEVDLKSETVKVQYVRLTFEELLDLLEGRRDSLLTPDWSGQVVSRQRYSSDEPEQVNEPAYGGFGNTNGIPEMGDLQVDKELLDHAELR
ncbi:MAG: hypothetical protein DRI61_11325 [Chloroflexi bacterium]|nr:MAG: hypothetical protein DRI61_11325 [Chloroflexota bacterium]